MSRSFELTLSRYAYLPNATLGRLTLPGVPYALYTIERPWIRNPAGEGGMPRVSCVPEGIYTLISHDSEKHPGTFQIYNQNKGVYRDSLPAGQTWGRTEILIHVANGADELEGCIAPGSSAVIYDNRPSLLMSAAAMDVVRSVLALPLPTSTIWIRTTSGTSEIEYKDAPKSGLPRTQAPTMV